MAFKESVIYDRVNVVRLVRHLDKSINEADWDTEGSSTKLVKHLADIRGLLDRLDVYMLSVNGPSLLTVPCPSLSIPRKPDQRTVQRFAKPSHVTSELLTTDDVEASVAAAAADVDLHLGSTDESDDLFLLPDRTPSTTGAHNAGGDTASESALLQHSTALQEELAAQPAQMAGQLRRNVEHVSGTLVADQGVLRVAEKARV
ncbi:hypothetical protein EDB92DRAFT_1944642 [Lactarius akahatsu]|uniref:Uncharacterized protein n=1 Tax=Lactarius akahatsu TaxID=416441 RepID=A0AAD4LK04_9AGAM|nr:hypothetical protein EDB92DRAFT_1944642 [Lactarius akahatsu]